MFIYGLRVCSLILGGILMLPGCKTDTEDQSLQPSQQEIHVEKYSIKIKSIDFNHMTICLNTGETCKLKTINSQFIRYKKITDINKQVMFVIDGENPYSYTPNIGDEQTVELGRNGQLFLVDKNGSAFELEIISRSKPPQKLALSKKP